MAPGSSVKLDILRNGKPIERTIKLGRLDESAVAGNVPRRDDGENDAPAPAKAGNRLGLAGQDLDADDRGRLGLRAGEGVGLLRVGPTPVGSAEALDRELSKSRESDTVMLLVRRGGANQFVAITPLADRGRP